MLDAGMRGIWNVEAAQGIRTRGQADLTTVIAKSIITNFNVEVFLCFQVYGFRLMGTKSGGICFYTNTSSYLRTGQETDSMQLSQAN